MPCPRFEEGALCRCTAVAGFVVPSLHERERFCRTDHSLRCPTRAARERRSEPLKESEYWALWLPATALATGDPPTV